MNKEIIFAIRYKAGNLGIGSPFGNEFAPANSGTNVINGSGRSYNYPSTSIINAFDANPNDKRKDVSLAEKYYNAQSNTWVDDDETTQCRFVKKYLSPVATVNDGESDWPVIRLADVLLTALAGADAQMESRRRTVEEVLDSLGATEAPRVEAVNKCDLIAPEAQSLPGALYISASTGENVEKLLLRVESELEAGAQEVRLLNPFSRYALVSRLHAMGGVLEQRHSDEGVELRMRITPQNVKFACREGAKVLGGEKM